MPYLESATTVRDASGDSRESSGAAMASISAPAPARWTGLAPSTRSRSKYTGSLPEPGRQSGPGRSAAWRGDRVIVMLLVPTVCRALARGIRLDTSAGEGSSRMGSMTRGPVQRSRPCSQRELLTSGPCPERSWMACRCWVIMTRRSEMTGWRRRRRGPAACESFTMRFRGNVVGAWPDHDDTGQRLVRGS